MKSCIILLNKKSGLSSNSAVNKVKHILGAEKAGHLGTLDVLATGLLPITINRATKLFDYFLTKDKVYKTIFTFGKTTDTLDLEGKITNTDDKIITKEMIEGVLPKFLGKMQQIPPQYSAKKINGKKAYDIARSGQEANLKPKEIEIYDLKLLRNVEVNSFELEVHCSSGTYIRALCRDIAESLSTYGVMSNLQRTKCGVFDIKDASTIDEIKNGEYKTMELDSIFDYDEIELDKKDFERLVNGVQIDYQTNGNFRAYYQDEYIGNVEVKENKMKFSFRLV